MSIKLVGAAEAIWAGDIHHEDGDHQSLFIRNEWGWAYTSDPSYCGHFVAVAARMAGVERDVAYFILPSTARLAGKVESANHLKPLADVKPEDIQEGDIVCVNPTNEKPYGTHIVLATSAPDERGYYSTIEGNSWGKRADGSNGKGVVKKYRRLTTTARAYRLKESQWK